MSRAKSKSPKIKEGDRVHYHPIIGREHNGETYTVLTVGELGKEPVAWLFGKSGCVSIEALSLAEDSAHEAAMSGKEKDK